MKLFVLLTALAAISLSAPAQAKTAKCLVLVDGKTLINEDCEFDPGFAKDGSFSLTADHPKNHIAYVDITKGVGEGYWNGSPPQGAASQPLGILKRNGACWYNERAIICAWAK